MQPKIRTVKDIRQLGTILSVWAHPDDESFSAAGILTTAVRNGQKVACITATKGEAGQYDKKYCPDGNIGEVRAKELMKALEIIGVEDHHWLGYIDGSCADSDSGVAVEAITKAIDRLLPDTILTFGPEGMTGHSDHQAVSYWVELAVLQNKHKPQVYHCVETREWYNKHGKMLDEKFNMYFAIDEPPLVEEEEADILYTLPREVCRRKCEALKAQESQTSQMFEQFSENDLQAMLNHETFMKANL